jgi:hypothetical protein
MLDLSKICFSIFGLERVLGKIKLPKQTVRGSSTFFFLPARHNVDQKLAMATILAHAPSQHQSTSDFMIGFILLVGQ